MKRATLLILLSVFLLGLAGTTTIVSPQGENTALLQYNVKGHTLAFGSGNWLISNGHYALDVRFIASNQVTPVGAFASRDVGQDTAQTRVTYPNLWDGVDVVYRTGARGIMESVYEISPNADVSAIRLRYNAPVTLNADGTLTTRFAAGQVTESAPIAWQEINGRRVEVAVSFEPRASNEIAFAVRGYDTSRELYIDPVLTWNTFLGSADNDDGHDIAVDGIGNVYVVGNSDATWGTGAAPVGCAGCPIRAHSASPSTPQDVFVAKLDAGGNLIWMTFLGSTATDAGTGITVDATGNVFVTGNSGASWGAGAAPSGCAGCPIRAFTDVVDVFAARLDPGGNLVWNTFLGGAAADFGAGIAVDAAGSAYVNGTSARTWGAPVRPFLASDDGFAAELNAGTGVLIWNTFLGSSDVDTGFNITADSTGTSIYAVGASRASWGSDPAPLGCAGCPIRPYDDPDDGYVAKLNTSGGLVWNTFLGGDGNDSAGGVALDIAGNVYVSGTSSDTWGTGAAPVGCVGCPVRPYTALNDTFAAKLTSAGALTWNTFLGGNGSDLGGGIAVNGAGTQVYLTGASDQTWGAPFRAYTASGADAFAAQLNGSGALVWSGFLGGAGIDSVGGIASDLGENVFLAGSSDDPWGTGAPPQGCVGCPVRAYNGSVPGTPVDAFAAKISNPPTAINVAGFGARVNRNGDAVLKWQTTTESQISGFDVFRKVKKGEWKKVNDAFIQAKHAGDVAGDKYRVRDTSTKGGKTYNYKVQVNYLDGHKEWTNVVQIKTP